MYIALYDVAIKYVKYIGHKEVIVAEAPLMVHICIENKERWKKIAAARAATLEGDLWADATWRRKRVPPSVTFQPAGCNEIEFPIPIAC